MIRKLIKQGKNALTLTVPFQWTSKNKLGSGSEIEIMESGETLVLSPAKSAAKKQIEIDLLSTNRWYVSQVIRNSYFSDMDTVILNYKDDSVYKHVKDTVELLIGFEIVGQKKGSCMIKKLSSLETEFGDLMKRIMSMTITIMGQVHHRKLDDSYEELRHIKKLVLYARRYLVEKHVFGMKKNRAYYMLNRNLAMIINNYMYIIEYMKKNKVKFSKETKQYLSDVRRLFSHFYEIHMSGKLDNLHELSEMRYDLIVGKLNKLFRSAKKTDMMVLHYLGEVVRITSSSGGFLFIIFSDKNEP